MADADDLVPPEETIGDDLHTLAKAGLNLPGIANAAELFETIIAPPLKGRTERWRQAVFEKLKELDSRIGGITRDDEFLDAVYQASVFAVRTSQEQKLEALANAACNASLPKQRPEAVLQQMFLHWVDEFSEWHLRLLKVLDDPKAWMDRNRPDIEFSLYRRPPMTIIPEAFPGTPQNDPVIRIVWSALYDKGLIGTSRRRAEHMMSLESFTTDLGKQFLAFIEVPIAETVDT